MAQNTVLFIFIDGVGIGEADPARNPLAAIHSKIYSIFADREEAEIAAGGVVSKTDACLGVPGLPQSATGQTTLLTGVNAPALLGRHLNGYPNQRLKDLLASESIFLQLARHGKRCAFANCYRPQFFQKIPRHISVTTAACLSAGIRLKTIEDLRAGHAVYQDFTHQYLRSKGIEIDLLSPEQAGANLAEISRQQDFTLYEHFLTDLAGHSCDWKRGIEVAENLERFLYTVLQQMDLRHQTLILSSDHGNFEDFSTQSHTRNPVYTLCWGRHRREVAMSINSIQDVTTAILRLFTDSTAFRKDPAAARTRET